MSRSRISALTILLSGLLAAAQTSQPPSPPPAPPPPAQTAPDQPSEPAIPPGKVLFSRDAASPPDSTGANRATAPNYDEQLSVPDSERKTLTFTNYNLDVHLKPVTSAISVRAGLTVRNDGVNPIARLVLQLSSTLNWDAFSTRSLASPGTVTPLTFAVHNVPTDADHTGSMDEAVVNLPQPLAPGASTILTALYAGTIEASADRLLHIGAPSEKAIATDWDAIAPGDPSSSNSPAAAVALRGFGNVLWYPISSPPISLSNDAKFVQAVGETKLRQSAATVRLRLAVEYIGDSPDAAFFCGRREHLVATSDNPNLPAAESPGIATALFDTHPLGFRTLSLFLTANAPTIAGTPANSDLIAAVTTHFDALPAYSAAAGQVEPLLTDWLGPQPLMPLNILDHPGQPFEDDALLVRPMRAVDPATLVPSLVHSLTHAWIRSDHAWIDEGLPEFTSLLWTERASGRPAALAALQDAAQTLALAEPAVHASATTSSSSSSSAEPVTSSSTSPNQPGTSLIDATGPVYYRTKAAAVWWMLRTILGDDALKQSIEAYRLDAKLDRDPAGLQHTLEKYSHQDLNWFFNDWVYRDRGLPDLNIVSVTPSQVDTTNGLTSGWLVAVTVRNDGYAVADVPVTVRSATSSETRRLRIPGQASISTRIIFAGTPEQVQVNDGGVPEAKTSVHTRQLVLPGH